MPSASHPQRSAASLILAALLQTAGGPALSQQADTVAPDARVRLMAVGADRWVVGKLLTASGDTVRLLVGDAGDSLALPTASLARFEVSRGKRRQTSRGAWIGAVAGAFAGVVVGAATYEECRGFCPAPDPGHAGSALLGGILFGVVGLGVGAVVGSTITAERWRPVPQPGAPAGG